MFSHFALFNCHTVLHRLNAGIIRAISTTHKRISPYI